MNNQSFPKTCEGAFRALLKAATDNGYSQVIIYDRDSGIWNEYTHNEALVMFLDLDMMEISIRSPSKMEDVWFVLVPEYGSDGSDLIADHINTFDADMIYEDWEIIMGFNI